MNLKLENKLFIYLLLIFLPLYFKIDLLFNKNFPISIFFLGIVISFSSFKLLRETLLNSNFLIILSLVLVNLITYFYLYYQGLEYFRITRFIYTNLVFLVFSFLIFYFKNFFYINKPSYKDFLQSIKYIIIFIYLVDLFFVITEPGINYKFILFRNNFLNDIFIFYHSYSTYSGILEIILITILCSEYSDNYKKKSSIEFLIDILSLILIFRAIVVSNNNTAFGIMIMVLIVYFFKFFLKKISLSRSFKILLKINSLSKNFKILLKKISQLKIFEFYSIFLISFFIFFIAYNLIFYSGFFIKYFQNDGLWSRFILFQSFASMDLKEFIFPALNLNLVNNSISTSLHNSFFEIISFLGPLIFILILIFLKKFFIKRLFEKYTFLYGYIIMLFFYETTSQSIFFIHTMVIHSIILGFFLSKIKNNY